MSSSDSARLLLRVSLVVLACAGLAGSWEVLARQAPGSPLYLGVLPGPIALLRETAFALGLLLFVASLLAARLPSTPRLLPLSLCAGALLALGAAFYAAANGMLGVQMNDLRPDALPLFVLKHAGFVLVGAGLLELGRRVF